MSHWIRFRDRGRTKFSQVEGETITVFTGNMFEQPERTGETVLVEVGAAADDEAEVTTNPHYRWCGACGPCGANSSR